MMESNFVRKLFFCVHNLQFEGLFASGPGLTMCLPLMDRTGCIIVNRKMQLHQLYHKPVVNPINKLTHYRIN